MGDIQFGFLTPRDALSSKAPLGRGEGHKRSDSQDKHGSKACSSKQ